MDYSQTHGGSSPYPNQYNTTPGYYPPPPPQGYGQPPPPMGYGQPPPSAHGYGQPLPPSYQPGPVVQQPMGGPGGWMNMPQGPTNCPPGLEYLTMIDQLLVHQKVELLEAIVGFETNNKFTVKNSMGQKVYLAIEDNDCLTRNCCGSARPFEMKILDNFRNQVMNLHRPLACDSCCFPCCLQSMEVSAPPGTIVGVVEQQWSILKPTFEVKNASGDVVLLIEGPFCTMSICGNVEFKVLTADGSREIGKISKQWSGISRELFTDADMFGITFPMDLDVRIKAVLLGACFLIDAMFFEKGSNSQG